MDGVHSANKKQQIKWRGQPAEQTLRRWQRRNRLRPAAWRIKAWLDIHLGWRLPGTTCSTRSHGISASSSSVRRRWGGNKVQQPLMELKQWRRAAACYCEYVIFIIFIIILIIRRDNTDTVYVCVCVCVSNRHLLGFTSSSCCFWTFEICCFIKIKFFMKRFLMGRRIHSETGPL